MEKWLLLNDIIVSIYGKKILIHCLFFLFFLFFGIRNPIRKILIISSLKGTISALGRLFQNLDPSLMNDSFLFFSKILIVSILPMHSFLEYLF